MPMKSVGVEALNSRLGEYVRMAAAGETILVTDRERVVAELGPLAKPRVLSWPRGFAKAGWFRRRNAATVRPQSPNPLCRFAIFSLTWRVTVAKDDLRRYVRCPRPPICGG